jgi:hypothetical protein
MKKKTYVDESGVEQANQLAFGGLEVDGESVRLGVGTRVVKRLHREERGNKNVGGQRNLESERCTLVFFLSYNPMVRGDGLGAREGGVEEVGEREGLVGHKRADGGGPLDLGGLKDAQPLRGFRGKNEAKTRNVEKTKNIEKTKNVSVFDRER